MSPPPQHTLETKIERETRLAAEYEEMECQRDAQHIAGVLSQQRPPHPQPPSLPPISTLAEPPAGVSRPAKPLFLAGNSAGQTLFLTSLEGEQDRNDPVDDVAPCSSPALVASASSTPSFRGVATNQELALVPWGLFFDAMRAVCVQDPPREWCVSAAPCTFSEPDVRQLRLPCNECCAWKVSCSLTQAWLAEWGWRELGWSQDWVMVWLAASWFKHRDSHDPLSTFDQLHTWWADLRAPDLSSPPQVPPVRPLSVLGS
ncbi:hypothetical protein DXG01_015079 [Tephrocybe rancida]|nr:hypothetical protein DXG01_015079 [Tephrocybe rancida]